MITKAKFREILNSRGNITCECELHTKKGIAIGSSPTGASSGSFEAVFAPKPVPQLVKDANNLISQLLPGSTTFQEADDIIAKADGTTNFSKVGGAVSTSASFAALKAQAMTEEKQRFELLGSPTLPIPLGNVFGGGAHAAPEAMDFQELLVVPTGAKTFESACKTNALVHAKIKSRLKDKKVVFCKSDEGGWTVSASSAEALSLVYDCANQVFDETGIKVRVGVDIAASELFDSKTSTYTVDGKQMNKEEMISFVCETIDRFELAYVEDPLEENDFEGFADLTKQTASKTLLCGDDLFVTNVSRLEKGIEIGACNSLIIKPNQIGNISKAIDAVRLAQKNKLVPVISHRSGETTDDTIAHLAAGLNAPFIKTGVVGGERISKLNELIRIEEKTKAKLTVVI
ncbi:MAG: hypothetical protein J7K00_03155 [Candidatus Diapherotrites archaeon]|nr:hypothetical protein [Candidatus Diapherotrites archaeon]